MKKIVTISVCTFIVAAVAVLMQVGQPVRAANVIEENDHIKVFIGNTETMSATDAKSYNDSQAEQLAYMAEENPNMVNPALITFDDFLTIEEVEAELESVEEITKVYIWMPGKDGRSIICVKDNNIRETIQDFFRSLNLQNEPESEYKEDMTNLIENYGIFAVEVMDECSDISSIAKAEKILRVDLIRSEEAQELAVANNKKISYICVPEKPDGTK